MNQLLNNNYDIDYEINKRKSYIRHLSQSEYDYEMNNGSMSVPEPVNCPGLHHIDECPRAQVVNAMHYLDACEYCSLSLDEDYVRNNVNKHNRNEVFNYEQQ